MKRLISMASIITIAASVNASAAVKCKPLVDEMKVQKAIVDDFSVQLIQAEKKVERLENKIYEKKSQIHAVTDQIKDEKSVLGLKENEKASLIQAISQIQIQKEDIISENISLSQRMSDLTVEINNLPVRSHARRTALRERKRAEKKIEANEIQLAQLQTQITPVEQLIADVDVQISQSVQVIDSLKAQRREIKQARPTLQTLENRKANAEQALIEQDGIQQSNIALLVDMEEKAMVCKTYKVKYPLALQIAKELYDVGCENYQPKNFNGHYKKITEEETIAQICNY